MRLLRYMFELRQHHLKADPQMRFLLSPFEQIIKWATQAITWRARSQAPAIRIL